MNKQKFLDGVRMKISIIQREYFEMEIVQKNQKKINYRQMKRLLVIFPLVILFIICTTVLRLSMDFILGTSFLVLLITVWIEIMEFECIT